MSQLKDIKERIESVKKTRKMTQAMKMVAAAKFKRNSNMAIASRGIIGEVDYSIAQVLGDMNGIFDADLMKPVSSNKELLIVIAADRGLCGGFNSNVLKYAEDYIKNIDHEVELVCFGRKACQFFKRKPYPILEKHENFQDNLTMDKISTLVSRCVELYETEEYCKISVIYNEFKSAMSSNLITKQLFPVNWSEDDESNIEENIIIEPSSDEMLDTLCELYIKYSFYNAFLESSAAEQGARMAAMDSATDNAGEMIKDLTQQYNRQRQAQITTELSEIVAGAEALVN